MNPQLILENDFRLAILRKAGVTIGSLYNYGANSLFEKLCTFILLTKSGNIFTKYCLNYFRNYIKRNLVNIYNREWCEKLLLKLQVSCVILDWAKYQTLLTGPVTTAAKTLAIPSISYPHGIDHVECDTYFAKINDNTFNHFDYIVLPNNIRNKYIATTNEGKKRTVVLGSLRFTEKWSYLLRQHYSDKTTKKATSGKIKVLYIDSAEKSEIVESIKLIRKLSVVDNIALTVQPRIIDDQKNDLFYKFENTNVNVDYSTPAVVLCERADIIIGTTSSIFMESFIQNKHFIFLRYISAHKTMYENYDACWFAESIEHILDLIYDISRNMISKDSSKINKFVREILNGGYEPGEIIELNLDFVTGVSVKNT